MLINITNYIIVRNHTIFIIIVKAVNTKNDNYKL